MPVIQALPQAIKPRFWDKNTFRAAALSWLLLVCTAAALYAHLILGLELMLAHFCYLPLVVAGIWWGRRAIWFALALGGWLLFSDFVILQKVPPAADLLGLAMFVAVGVMVGSLREKSLRDEQHLRRTRDFLDKLIRYSNAPIVVWDPDRRITRLNRALERISGRAAAEITGRDLGLLIPEKRQQELLRQVDVTASWDHWNAVEIPIRCADGTERLILWSLSNIYAEDRVTRLGTLAQGIDITERKEAEEALRESRQELIRKHAELNRLFTLVEMAKQEWEGSMDCVGDMVVRADREGRITRCNRAVKEFVHKSYPEILGTYWDDLLPAGEIDIDKVREWGMEVFHHPTGKWFLIRSYPFLVEGERTGSVVILHDATQIKNMTQELERAYTELEATQAKILQQEKMASMGQLAAGVAHEINNPIGFIASNLGTLVKYVGRLTEFLRLQSEIIGAMRPDITEDLERKRKTLKLDYITGDIKELINETLEGTNRVIKIVQNLRNFARVDQAEFRHADINKCLESTIEIAWNELKYKVTLHKEFGRIPLTKCYPHQLNQVFLNLLVNAAQAIEKKGEITIKTMEENGSVLVSVSDTGCGIPEQHMQRVFEPFFTTKEADKGTGLGLSISYDIIKKHNGDLAVKSAPGEGTTFFVRIPIVEGRHG